MDKAKRARTAETPKQPSLGLKLRAPYLYPDALPAGGVVGGAFMVSTSWYQRKADECARRKGTRNRFGGDLREEIVAAIKETGFIRKNKKGEPVGTGKDGCKGFIKWLALHEPKTAAALFARVLPYFINVSVLRPGFETPG
jgi:hypothetical protein